MRSIQEARNRWRALFTAHTSRESLKHAITQRSGGGPCEVGLRSVCWKVCLLFPEFDPTTWGKTLATERSVFGELRDSYTTSFDKGCDFAAGGIDPLAEDESNPWDRFRKDEELRKEIVQDVERCMPDVAYFRDAKVQASLLDVLFVYCKLNEDLGYRQGMHEIVAVILWVLSGDAISPDQTGGEGEELEEHETVMRSLLDPRFIEHDAFSLFQVIMRSAKAWYELGEEGEGGKIRGRADGRGKPPIVEKSKYIHEQLLMAVDPELGDHLKALDVLPQVFLIRWIRLLFGREFPLPELLEVWDSLFAEDPNLQLVDYICVAMLLRIRWPLVEADYSTALTLVLRYPSPAAPHVPATFVADAIHLRENLTLAGGRHIVMKYSDRAPAALKPKRRETANKVPTLSRTKSPLGSPTRFIPGVQLDSVIQDVARNVLDRGEKWGVNRAVGRAVVEVKKNVQGFQQQQQQQWAEATKEMAREEELVRRSRALSKRLKADEERRKQLEKLLGLSIEMLEQEPLDAVRRATAIDKLRHVRECLADGTKMLDTSLLENIPTTPDTPPTSAKRPPPTFRRSSSAAAASPLNPASPLSATLMAKTPSSPPGNFVKTSFKNNSDPDFLTHKPRSSLAQSSFAWMLGDDPAVKVKTSFVSSSSRKGNGEMGRVDGEGVKSDGGGDEGFDLRNMRAKR